MPLFAPILHVLDGVHTARRDAHDTDAGGTEHAVYIAHALLAPGWRVLRARVKGVAPPYALHEGPLLLGTHGNEVLRLWSKPAPCGGASRDMR